MSAGLAISNISEPSPLNTSLILDQEERCSLMNNDSINKHNHKMTFWSVFATCIACLGGFLFGKEIIIFY